MSIDISKIAWPDPRRRRRWKRIDVLDSEFKSFDRESINEMFE